jgi:signal transduction histidine kinase
MQDLIEHLLDKAVLETGRAITPQTIALKPFLQSLLDDAHTLATQKSLSLSLDTPALHAQLDSLRMRQALTNLLSNAIKYTPENGKIALIARTSDQKLTLVIQDSGMGIPPDDIPHLFEPFYRVKQNEHTAIEGTGLGLSIVKAIVEQHHGSIQVESVLGQGTLIQVVLPNALKNPQ